MHEREREPTVPGTRADHPRLVLVILGSAFFMTVLDSTSVIAALPSISAGLALRPDQSAWVLTAYGVAVGGFLLTAGRLSDVYGARRVFLVATAVFALASAACGLATGWTSLITARGIQGLAAAAMTPSALALLLAAHHDEIQRGRAIGIWGGLGGIGATAGLLVGGALTTIGDWTWVFWINVPVCIAVLAASRSMLPDPVRRSGRSTEWPAALALCGVLTAATFVLLHGAAHGWNEAPVVGAVAVAVILGPVFLVLERRSSDPVLPPRLWRMPGVRSGNAVVLMSGIVVDGLLYLTSRQAQEDLSLSPLAFGGLAAIMTITSFAGVLAGQALVRRMGVRTVATTGMAVLTAAGVLLAMTSEHGVPQLALGLAVFGPGMGLAFVAGQIACLRWVPDADAGIASGIEETSFSVGSMFGTGIGAAAAIGAASTWGGPAFSGSSRAYLVIALVGLAGCVVSRALPSRDRT